MSCGYGMSGIVLGAESVLAIVFCRSKCSFKLIEVILFDFGCLATTIEGVKCVWHIWKTILLVIKCREYGIFNKGVVLI